MITNFKKYRPKIHRSAFVAPTASVVGRVEIGAKSTIWYGVVLRGDINKIKIGSRTNIQDNAVVHVEDNMSCTVGNGVIVGHQATIHACRIGDDALIGIGSRILSGSVIGRGAVVAANSVVLEGKRIPPYSLAVGTPARVVRKLTPREIAKHRRSAAGYVKLGAWFVAHPASPLVWDPAITPIDDLSRIF